MIGLPALHVRVGGDEWLRLDAPDFGARAWLLGVVAVQVTVEAGRAVAQARAHVTGGAAPVVRALPSPSELHVALVDAGAQAPPAPIIPKPIDVAGGARLALFLDGVLVDAASLPADGCRASPPARGFGHVFCRWLRAGGIEPGFDLTDFVSQPPGRKFERRLVRAFAAGQVVSYQFVSV